LDAKARLVLPLSIRDCLNIKSKDQILLSVSSISENFVTIKLAKAPEICQLNLRVFSKNGSYIKNKGGNENE
jgi:bifunctional DNA-binding transcriptional regulator/antitoxin component of YhaV-PrlF toxin-antitoxin module